MAQSFPKPPHGNSKPSLIPVLGFDALFWSLRAIHTCGAHIYMQKKFIHMKQKSFILNNRTLLRIQHYMPGMVVHTFNPSIGEAEAGNLCEMEDTLVYIVNATSAKTI